MARGSAFIDKLDRRLLLTVSAANGTLSIQGDVNANGSAVNDTVEVHVTSSGKSVSVTQNGKTQLVPAKRLKRLAADLGKGNDLLDASKLGAPCFVISGDGNDSIHTGSGNDQIIGGLGNDLIVAGKGDDSLNGGAASITGGDGDDSLDGGEGSDVVDYGSRTDDLQIGIGKGIARGAADKDKLVSIHDAISGSGDDLLIGSAGDDFLRGGEGSDTIFALG